MLSGKIGDPALAVVEFAVRQRWSSSRDLQEALRRVSRTAMFRRAERTGELDEVEDQLFRFSRIVDASPELSVILDDPDRRSGRPVGAGRPAAGRSRAHPLVTELVDALARDTAGRSFTHGVRELVDQAAQRRDKIVAIVKTAVAVDRRAVDPAGRPLRPDLRPGGVRARRGRTVGARRDQGAGRRRGDRRQRRRPAGQRCAAGWPVSAGSASAEPAAPAARPNGTTQQMTQQ